MEIIICLWNTPVAFFFFSCWSEGNNDARLLWVFCSCLILCRSEFKCSFIFFFLTSVFVACVCGQGKADCRYTPQTEGWVTDLCCFPKRILPAAVRYMNENTSDAAVHPHPHPTHGNSCGPHSSMRWISSGSPKHHYLMTATKFFSLIVEAKKQVWDWLSSSKPPPRAWSAYVWVIFCLNH